MPLIVVFPPVDDACPETVICKGVAEMYPLLSSAITVSVCAPAERKICVLIEFVKVKYTASVSTYTRMKKIGFLGLALATTFKGDVTVEFAVGFETVNGKSFEPFFHGAVLSFSAGGAGTVGSADGVQVMLSGGIDGKLGCEGFVGAGLLFVVFMLAPHPVHIGMAMVMEPMSSKQVRRPVQRRRAGDTPIVFQTSSSRLNPGTTAEGGPGTLQSTNTAQLSLHCRELGSRPTIPQVP